MKLSYFVENYLRLSIRRKNTLCTFMTTRLPQNAVQTVRLPVRNGGVAPHVQYYGANVLPFFHVVG